MARNQVPFVPFQRVEINAAPSTRQSIDGVSAEAFGGAEGRAMQGFGQKLADVFDPWAKEEMRLQQYKDTSTAIDFETKVGQQFENDKVNLTGTGEGFAKGFLQSVDKQAEEIRKANGGQVPRGFDIALQRIKTSYFDRALKVELQKRDEFYQTDINTKLQPIFAGAAANPDPKARDGFAAQARKLIESSGLPAGTKEAMLKKTEEDLDMAYGLGLKDTNPDRVVTSLGGEGSLAIKVGMKESGNKPIGKHPGSSAWGRYGFIEDRWIDVANSPEGKAAGLNPHPDGRKDDAQQKVAFPIHMRMLAKELTDAGYEATDKNLFLAHFLGHGAAKQMLGALKKDPDASAAQMFPKAAASNPAVFYYQDGSPRTIAAVYDLQTRGLEGKPAELGGDPVLSRLSFNNQQRLLSQAENVISNQLKAQIAEQKADYANYINDFQLRLRSGQFGAGDIEAAVRSGRITDYNDIKKLEETQKRYTEDVSDAQTAAQRLASGGPFNQFDDKDRKEINALGEAVKEQFPNDPGRQLAGYQSIFAGSGIVPKQMIAMMRQAASSTNPQDIQGVGQLAQVMLAERPNAFKGLDNGAELERMADRFQHNLALYGDPAKAAQVMAQDNDPEKANVFQKKDIEDKKAALLKEPTVLTQKIVNDLGLNGWFSRSPQPQTAAIASQMNADFAELYLNEYKRTGKDDEAKSVAMAQLKRTWGEFNGEVMRHPPQKTYKDVGGKWDWVQDSVKGSMERVLPRLHPGTELTEVKLMSTQQTVQDIAAGKPARYDVLYTYKDKDGVSFVGVLNGKQGWNDANGADYKKAYDEWAFEKRAEGANQVTLKTLPLSERRPNETPQQSVERVNRERARQDLIPGQNRKEAQKQIENLQSVMPEKPLGSMPGDPPPPRTGDGVMFRGRMVVPGAGNARN